MIKLIATDLDGSLLNDEKQTPSDLDWVLEQLEEKGVAFAAVTGRNFHATEPALGERAYKMICVCNNGANIYENGVNTINHPITQNQVHRTITAIREMDNTAPLIFTLDKCYSAPGPESFMEWAKAPYSPIEWVDSYDELYNITDEVYKISVYDGSGQIEDYSYPVLRNEMEKDCAVYISGEIWVDVVNTNASKGAGLRILQEKLGVTKEETMAFGDYHNDATLLAEAGYPFVMENGVQRLKDKYPLRADYNNNGGVTKAITEYVIEKSKQLP